MVQSEIYFTWPTRGGRGLGQARMIEFFSNPWVIGIGGGLVSGVVVTSFSRLVLIRGQNRDYRQKVRTANTEIMHALRPSISEQALPPLEILDAVIAATAAKYSVQATDLYSRDTLANDLIKEIMDSGFLSAQQKLNFANLVGSLKLREEHAFKTEIPMPPFRNEVTERQTIFLSTTLGLMTAIVVSVFTVSIIFTGDQDQSLFSDPVFLMIMIFSIMIPILGSMAYAMSQFVRMRSDDQRRTEQGSTAGESSEDQESAAAVPPHLTTQDDQEKTEA